MKKHVSLIIAAAIIGLALFIILIMIPGMGYQMAFTIALSGALSGLIVEYLKPVLAKKKKTS